LPFFISEIGIVKSKRPCVDNLFACQSSIWACFRSEASSAFGGFGCDESIYLSLGVHDEDFINSFAEIKSGQLCGKSTSSYLRVNVLI